MRVKIIKSESGCNWYADKIGDCFDVSSEVDEDGDYTLLRDPDYYIGRNDCEIVEPLYYVLLKPLPSVDAGEEFYKLSGEDLPDHSWQVTAYAPKGMWTPAFTKGAMNDAEWFKPVYEELKACRELRRCPIILNGEVTYEFHSDYYLNIPETEKLINENFNKS